MQYALLSHVSVARISAAVSTRTYHSAVAQCQLLVWVLTEIW
jgi:hypothetical protein